MQSIKIYPNTKIYIFAPKGYRTGGVTLLHQFASRVIKNAPPGGGVEPEIYYYDIGKTNASDDVYSKYHIKPAKNMRDEPQNILILPESATYFLYDARYVQKIIWWMSVDNYFYDLAAGYVGFYNAKDFLSVPAPRWFNFTDNENICHFVQSRYAFDFLRINRVPEEKICYVGDYLEPVFLKRAKNVDITKKERIIAYNPLKGLEFTEKIMEFAPHIKFIPIENMTTEEVEKLLARAMVYIDFGNHPGKDRIPREAAISGCVVITGKCGAAANNEDIPIDAEFKFDDDEREIPNIIKKIEAVFNDFPLNYAKFEKYREIIFNEPEKFENDVINALNLPTEKNFQNVALLQSGEKAKLCKECLKNFPQFKAVFAIGEENIEDTEAISLEDAAFLYSEGRIEKFAVLGLSENERTEILNKLDIMNIPYEDCLTLTRK